MNSERIKEIQQSTAYPDSISVQQALLQVWNECDVSSKIQVALKEIKTKILAIDGNSKEERRAKGAYADAIVTIQKHLNQETK